MIVRWALAAVVACSGAWAWADEVVGEETVVSEPVPAKSQQTAHSVVSVVDGDTVRLRIDGDTVIVRLLGVDTPELGLEGRSAEPYGQQATMFLTNLLMGESVYVQHDPGQPSRDVYGRPLVYLFRAPEGLFVNLEVVRQGYGRAYIERPLQHGDLLGFYERRARASRKGIWLGWVDTTTTVGPRTGSSRGPRPDGGSIRRPQSTDRVYVTDSGDKFHRPSCQHLSKSSIRTTRGEAVARQYQPCDTCKP